MMNIFEKFNYRDFKKNYNENSNKCKSQSILFNIGIEEIDNHINSFIQKDIKTEYKEIVLLKRLLNAHEFLSNIVFTEYDKEILKSGWQYQNYEDNHKMDLNYFLKVLKTYNKDIDKIKFYHFSVHLDLYTYPGKAVINELKLTVDGYNICISYGSIIKPYMTEEDFKIITDETQYPGYFYGLEGYDYLYLD